MSGTSIEAHGHPIPNLASHELFATVYAELRQIAARELRRNGGSVVSPTTLIHETFLSLSQRKFLNEPHFLAYAARAMRGLIINQLRSRGRQKRGGEYEITSLPAELPSATESDHSVEKLGDALERLALINARFAECIDLRFFCGFSLGEIARMWDVSERTVQRDWDKARMLLHRLMESTLIPEEQPQT
ncbi:MAG: ECF-type sigma factor [Steroidobacter sp.]